MNARSATSFEDVDALFAAAFERGSIGMALVALDGTFLKVNDSLCALLTRPRGELIGFPWETFTLSEDSHAQSDVLHQVLERASGFVSREVRFVRPDGSRFWAQLNVLPLTGRDGHPLCFFVQATDITRKKEGEGSLALYAATVELLKRVALAANEADTIEAAMRVALTEVCAYTGWPIGHALTVRGEGDARHAVTTSIWHVRGSVDVEAFQELSEGLSFRLGYGLPGRVLETGRPVWEEDYYGVANFPRSRAALGSGIRSAFAFPITHGSEVVAVLEFFSFKPEVTDESLMEVMANVGSSLGRVVERTRAEDALRASEARIRTIIDTASDPYIEIDLEGRITTWNAEAEKTFGWTSAEVVGRRLSETLIPHRYRAAHDQGLKHFAAAGEGPILRTPVELTALHRSGKEFPVELTVWPVQAEGRWTFSAFIRNITDRVRLEEELRRLSTVDELTGLKNRREFMNLALREIALARRMNYHLTLLFIDLDRLKDINDAFGHKEGDRAIVDVADMLVRTFRDTDLIGRVGGDEFCVLETATEEGAARASLARLFAAIEDFNRSGYRSYQLSVSVGTASFDPQEPLTIQELMDEADRAMYEHKARRAARPRLLVVDDDHRVRRLAERIFSNEYEVATVSDGASALASVLVARPDVVVLDLVLPDMPGTEVARRIRARPLFEDVRILALTGSDPQQAEIESLSAGVDDFVAKPFDYDVLRLRIRNLLQRTSRR